MVRDLLAALGIQSPPVDLLKVATSLGVQQIKEEPLGSLWGSVSADAGELTIRLNDKAPHKKRFTLAHEIGHTILQPELLQQPLVAMRKPGTYGATERLCDEIAQEMLLPYDMFKQKADERAVSIKTIEALAVEFDTSVEATAIRYAKLTSHPVRLVAWRVKGDSAEVKWARGPGKHGRSVVRGRRCPISESTSLKHAMECQHVAVGQETIDGVAAYGESKRYGTGDGSYCLTLIKSPVTAIQLKGYTVANHAACEKSRRES